VKSAPVPTTNNNAAQLSANIEKQGGVVRELKTAKATKPEIDVAVKALLDLKAQYKSATGQDWKPESVAAPSTTTSKAPAAAAGDFDAQINKQGELVRNLKAQKATKAEVDAQVKVLLELKAQFKQSTGKDWKPTTTAAAAAPSPPATTGQGAADINDKITKQGDHIRIIKAAKASKADVEAQVKVLLELKAEYKKVTGIDWKPTTTPAAAVPQKTQPVTAAAAPVVVAVGGKEGELLGKIAAQGDQVRQLKAKKADKATITAAVNTLLALKTEYKEVTGKVWTPDSVTAAPNKENMAPTDKTTPLATGNTEKDSLTQKVTDQGNTVRQLKTSGAAKPEIDAAIQQLLALKAEYKKVTGEDFPAPAAAPRKPTKAPVKKDTGAVSKKPEPKAAAAKDDGGAAKKQTRLGLEAKKEENLPDWYSQVITKGELIEYYDVSGCYILRHWSYAVWKVIKSWFDDEITKMGVKECYFPMFVSRAALEKEKTHIADFAPEVAWVTKSGDSDLAEHIAIRPTSETVMYPAFAKWVQSYRDLPIRLNQWSNVVVSVGEGGQKELKLE
jgi:bifunctional glutamyl/prolyl-tRNA synthetase